MLKTHKYRISPTEEQKQTLIKWFGAVRFVFNLGLETKIACWASAKKNITCFDLMRQLTDLKKGGDCEWIFNAPRQSLESSITNLDRAYTKFFKGFGFPKFKKRTGVQTIIFRLGSKIESDKIRLTKIGWIQMVQHREIPAGEIRTVTLSKTPADSWFVSILVDDKTPLPEKKPVSEETAVGVDLGLKAFVALSDGQSFESPKFLAKQLKRLRIEQRTLARRYKKGVKTSEQSKGWHKQKLVVAKLHEKITNQRQHFLHNISTAIIKQYDTVCLEDLNVAGMMKNGNLAKSISDASWSEFVRMLTYKAEWNGKNIKKIGRFDPSSKLCSTCGNIFKELKLSDREWTCEKCGTKHDRDINAAVNIKTFGLKAKAILNRIDNK